MIEPGDCLPTIALQRADGTPLLLNDQRIAGVPLVVALGGAGGLKAQAAFAEAGLGFKAIEVAEPDAEAGAHVLYDAKGAYGPAVGIHGAAYLVVAADQRLIAVLDGGLKPAKAAVEAQALIAAQTVSARPIEGMHAPVLTLRGLFEPELCEKLVKYWARQDKKPGGVASSSANDNEVVRTDYKRRADVILEDKKLFETVKARIARRAAPMMFRAFQFQLASMEALRLGCYDAEDEGFFGRHRDNGTPHTAWRKFAMSVNLNDPASYEGGGVVFPEFGGDVYRPAAGDAVIFSCTLLHEALPVTQGQRFGLFTFFTDAQGLAAQKAAQQRSRAAGKSGVVVS